jgi:hypothetical protein
MTTQHCIKNDNYIKFLEQDIEQSDLKKNSQAPIIFHENQENNSTLGNSNQTSNSNQNKVKHPIDKSQKKEFLKRRNGNIAPCNVNKGKAKKYQIVDYSKQTAPEPLCLPIEEMKPRPIQPVKISIQKNEIDIAHRMVPEKTQPSIQIIPLNSGMATNIKAARAIQENDKSNIVNKMFFPKGKSAAKKLAASPKKQAKPEESKYLKIIKDKMTELTKEMNAYKEENEKINKLKLQCENEAKRLTRKEEDASLAVSQFRVSMNAIIEQETKKANKEKKNIERIAKAAQNVPTRQERKEMEELRKSIEEVKAGMIEKEKKTKLCIDRLRKQNKDLLQSNNEYQNEVENLKLVVM